MCINLHVYIANKKNKKMRTDARAEKYFLTEFSIPAPLDVKQDGGGNGGFTSV